MTTLKPDEMGKLNQKQRQTVGTNCKSASVANKNRNNVIVYCNDKDAGLRVKGALSAAYPDYKFSKEEVGNGMSAWETVTSIATLGGWNLTTGLVNNWKVFTVKTGTNYNASQLVAEINDCINDYSYAGYDDPDVDDPEVGGYNGGNEGPSGNKAKDWTTYIIIGVAVAVIILLLWDRKKK